MAKDFQRIYNELKKKSFDIALRISDLESALGHDNVKIIKLKKSFSKLQSAVNYALYYRKNNMQLEAANHIKFADNMSKYIYTVLEVVEIPKTEIELELGKKLKKKDKKIKRKGFRLRPSRKVLFWLVVGAIVYSLFMYLFFIK